MPITPAGPISAPMEALRQSLSRVSAWQTWCGAPDAPTALTRIYLIAPDPPEGSTFTREELEELRPFIVINFADNGFRYEQIGVGAYRGRCVLRIRIEADVPAAYEGSERDAELDFRNKLGLMLRGLCALGDSGEFVVSPGAGDPGNVQRDSRRSGGDYFTSELDLEGWGLG